MNDRREWFAAKTHGYGAGLPIAWQGWVLLIIYLLIVSIGALFLASRSVLAFLALVLPATFIFVMIAMNTTRGGWRWRWGDDR